MESPDPEKQFYFQWHFIERCKEWPPILSSLDYTHFV